MDREFIINISGRGKMMNGGQRTSNHKIVGRDVGKSEVAMILKRNKKGINR